jgi:hypothetical protein
MELPGRTFSATTAYRYSINGQEKTPEIAPNTTTAMYWEYDSRIMRRWNVDPVMKEWESPYLCFAGNPVWFSDPNGDDADGGGKKKAKKKTKSGKANDKKTLSESKINSALTSLQYKDSRLGELSSRILELKEIIKDRKRLFKLKAVVDVCMCWNPLYFGPQMMSDATIGSDLDNMAGVIADNISELNSKTAEFNKLKNEYSNESEQLKFDLDRADNIKLNSGVTIDKLAAVSITVNKNTLTSVGDWKLYEILVDGQTFKFGIADATRIRQGGKWAGIPERLAQQLSKIDRYAPEIALTFRTTTLLQMTKAKALKIEAEAIKVFANFHGIPIGNVKEIAKWAKEFGVSGLSTKTLTILKRFLKF